MPVTSWSTTAANNNASPPNGAPEGMAPSGVNDVLRQIMADVARECQINGVKKLNNVSGTNTITADMDPELASYAAGMVVVLTPANTNTGAATLAVDGLTALDILKLSGEVLVAGDLIAGVPYLLLLDSGGDDFYVLSNGSAGSFTATLTGMSGATTGTLKYRISDGVVTLYADATITGTSNADTLTVTGLPAAIQPLAARKLRCYWVSSGVDNVGNASLAAGSGTLTAALDGSLFPTSGTKGIAAGWSITYAL